MTSNLKPIEKTAFSYYFDDIDANTVFELTCAASSTQWTQDIDKTTPSYFRLAGDNWLMSNQSVVVGRWIEAYNSNDNSIVERLLIEHLNWEGNDVVRFYIAKSKVLETRWKYFLKYWDSFLAVEDDCPILILSHID